MQNIKFIYLYRDPGNYKKWAQIVFSNSKELGLDSIVTELQAAFLQDGLFIAHQIRVPDVFFCSSGNATSDDHCFHEFHGVEESLEAPNDIYSRSVGQFLAEVNREAKRGWVAFDPRDALQRRSN